MNKVDGLEIRNQIAEDYQRNAQRLGKSVTAEEAKALATADLQLVERLDSEKKVVPSTKPVTQIEGPDVEPTVAEQMAHEKGGRLVKREVKEAPILSIADIRRNVGEKAFAMLKRFELIMQRAPGGDLRDPGKINWIHPRLAKMGMQIHANFTFRKAGYKGLREKDRHRKFWADIEQLCELSKPTMGAWWVK